MSDTKKYYWLKLKKDFFIDKRIKKLRTIAGGDTYTIIYLKMQLLSLQDDGYLYFDGVEKTFEEEIALQIDEEIEDVKITINFMKNYKLIQQLDDTAYELIETKKCIGSETRNAESMRKLRAERLKSVTLLQDVTKSYTEKEKEKEIDKEKKKNKKEKYFKNEEVNNIFLEFLQLRKKIKAVNSDRAIKLLINQLEKYDDDTKIKMIEQSILNSWKSVYEIKNKSNKNETNLERLNRHMKELEEEERRLND